MHAQNDRHELVHKTLARVRALASRRRRDAEGCYYIEGVRHFIQAHDAAQPFDAVIYSPILLPTGLVEMLVRRLGASGVPRVRVTPEQFRSISVAPRASGVGAIVRQRWTSLDRADFTRGLGWLVLEDLQSPGNLGTILRTAEAVGASGIIFAGPACDPFDPAVVRAAMGGLFHLPLVRATHRQIADWANSCGVQLVGLSPEAERLWTELPSTRPIAIVLGGERQGLSPALRSLCDASVRLPMTGRADSLNVGVAAGVMMYELMRREQAIATQAPDQVAGEKAC